MASVLEVQNVRSISAFRAFRSFLRDAFDGLHGPHASVDVALSWSTTRITETVGGSRRGQDKLPQRCC
jgi:hypothetical protein